MLLIIIRYAHLQCNHITSLTVTAPMSSLRNEKWYSLLKINIWLVL